MRAGALALMTALLARSLATGCQGESSFVIPGVDAGSPDVRYEASCSAWAEPLCAHEMACSMSLTWIDTAQCVARETLLCELVAGEPNVVFDPTAVAACSEPDAGDCVEPYGSLCLGPGRGLVGSACLSSEACESGFCAYGFDPASDDPTACGACQALPCNGGCSNGQQCESSVDAGPTCVSIGAPGDHCVGQGDCAGYYYCGPDSTCAAEARLGEACGGGTTKGPPCGDFDTYCDSTQHCRAYVSAPYGAPCGVVGNDTYLCAGSGTCDPTDSQCLPPASDGDVCDDSQGLGCLPPARCILNRCVFPSLALCGADGL